MNFSIDDFTEGFKTIDITLWAGVALVVYVLFKEQIHSFVGKIQNQFKNIHAPDLPSIGNSDFFNKQEPVTKEDIFFELIKSWKKTRDLALECDCSEAVKVADEMFPYLSPVECSNAPEQHDTETSL